MPKKSETAYLGGGCFWCTEAIFQELKGVLNVEPGYSGGFVPNPDYETVCSGTTGHAEVIKVEFDPQVISYENLLQVFFDVHDPTTPNQQGNDVGPQYRSVIFTLSSTQKNLAKTAIRNAQKNYPNPIVTEVTDFEKFYPAEDEHHNYYAKNPVNPYCSFVIAPKIKHFRDKYRNWLKSDH